MATTKKREAVSTNNNNNSAKKPKSFSIDDILGDVDSTMDDLAAGRYTLIIIMINNSIIKHDIFANTKHH